MISYLRGRFEKCGKTLFQFTKRRRTLADGYVTTLHPPGSDNDRKLIVDAPVLVRPIIKWKSVAVKTLLPVFISGFIAFLSIDLSVVMLLIYVYLHLDALIDFAIRIYQKYASESLRRACVYNPSCSEFMALSIEKYGLFAGLLEGYKRLKRCHLPNCGDDYP